MRLILFTMVWASTAWAHSGLDERCKDWLRSPPRNVQSKLNAFTRVLSTKPLFSNTLSVFQFAVPPEATDVATTVKSLTAIRGLKHFLSKNKEVGVVTGPPRDIRDFVRDLRDKRMIVARDSAYLVSERSAPLAPLVLAPDVIHLRPEERLEIEDENDVAHQIYLGEAQALVYAIPARRLERHLAFAKEHKSKVYEWLPIDGNLVDGAWIRRELPALRQHLFVVTKGKKPNYILVDSVTFALFQRWASFDSARGNFSYREVAPEELALLVQEAK